MDSNDKRDKLLFLADLHGNMTATLALEKELERIGNFKVTGNVDMEGGVAQPASTAMPGQESIFNPDNVVYRKEDKLRNTVRSIDITKVTPLEAMNILYGLIEEVKAEDSDGQD